MSTLESNKPRRRLPVVVVVLLIVAAGLAAGAYYLKPRLESDAPQITFTPNTYVLGTAPMEIGIADRGAGLRSVTATLSAGGAEHALANEQYAEPVKEMKITLAASKLAGIKEGPAVLQITARDRSLWRFFRGNETVLRKEITIDITPPTIALLSDDRYVNFGGVGAIVYKPSDDTVTSGVKIGGHLFPGYKGQVKDHPDQFIALFAHPYDVPAEARAVLFATDKAGNTREVPLVYELKNVKYRKSTLTITDGFIQQKVAPLLSDVGARGGSPKDMFIAVNKRLRKVNEDKIAAITGKSTPSVFWKGAFAQLSNSKVEANFADHRTYVYNNEPIDTAYHLGYDLAVTKHYPVEAANSGTVAFAGDLGIYGNAVILDHGLGLFTLYGHLSSIDVKEGDSVRQRQSLGKTGETGLAGGDHLHFGVYLDGVAVLPVEWWDAKWINDNIYAKLNGQGGETVAESQPPKAKPRKASHKRPRRR